MGDYNTKLKDEEYDEVKTGFKNYCEDVENLIKEYKTVLKEISIESISSGEVHDALELFITKVDELDEVVSEIGIKFTKMLTECVERIDSIGAKLYYKGQANATRDFTQEHFDYLVSCLDDPWCSLTDGFDDFIRQTIYNVGELFVKEHVRNYLNSSHQILLDINDVTKKELICIFNKVQAVDMEYGRSVAGVGLNAEDYYTSNFACIYLTMKSVKDILDEMADVINPHTGQFSVDNITIRLNRPFEEMYKHYEKTIAIPIRGEKTIISRISDFASQPWAAGYFTGFTSVTSLFLADVGIKETGMMLGFQLFDVAKDVVTPGDYEKQQIQKKMLEVLGEVAEEYQFSASDEKAAIDNIKDFYGYVKKYEDKWYKYMNTHRDDNGTLLLDGRTKEAKRFRDFIDGIGGAQVILQCGSEAIDYIARLFQDYSYGLELIDSVSENYTSETAYIEAFDEITALYNKEFGAWAKEAVNTGIQLGFEVAFYLLRKNPVGIVIKGIEEGIDLIGDFTGMGEQAQGLYDACGYISLQSATQQSYENALKKFNEIDTGSEEYQVLADNLYNCFIVNKSALQKMFQAMSDAVDGMKKSYYRYCAQEVTELNMYDKELPYLMSYEEYALLS